MAVIPGVPGHSCRVRVGAQLAEEYQDSDGPDEEMELANSCCYIESRTGVQFSVEVTLTPEIQLPSRHNAVGARVSIDGTFCNGNLIKSTRSQGEPYTTVISDTCTRSRDKAECMARSFIFAPVCHTDDSQQPSKKSTRVAIQSLGTILVQITTGTSTGPERPNTPKHPKQSIELRIHEKALKGKDVSHGTSFSSGRQTAPREMYSLRGEDSLAEFRFKYRSHESLQRIIVIPRSPSPEPLSLEDQLANMSEGDIRRLAMEKLQEKKMKQESAAMIKRESDGVTCTPRPQKMAKLDEGRDAIDLTNEYIGD